MKKPPPTWPWPRRRHCKRTPSCREEPAARQSRADDARGVGADHVSGSPPSAGQSNERAADRCARASSCFGRARGSHSEAEISQAVELFVAHACVAVVVVPLVAVPNSGQGKIAAQTCTSLNFRSAALAVFCAGASDQINVRTLQ